jgi:hypothetical protein
VSDTIITLKSLSKLLNAEAERMADADREAKKRQDSRAGHSPAPSNDIRKIVNMYKTIDVTSHEATLDSKSTHSLLVP